MAFSLPNTFIYFLAIDINYFFKGYGDNTRLG